MYKPIVLTAVGFGCIIPFNYNEKVKRECMMKLRNFCRWAVFVLAATDLLMFIIIFLDIPGFNQWAYQKAAEFGWEISGFWFRTVAGMSLVELLASLWFLWKKNEKVRGLGLISLGTIPIYFAVQLTFFEPPLHWTKLADAGKWLFVFILVLIWYANDNLKKI